MYSFNCGSNRNKAVKSGYVLDLFSKLLLCLILIYVIFYYTNGKNAFSNLFYMKIMCTLFYFILFLSYHFVISLYKNSFSCETSYDLHILKTKMFKNSFIRIKNIRCECFIVINITFLMMQKSTKTIVKSTA